MGHQAAAAHQTNKSKSEVKSDINEKSILEFRLKPPFESRFLN